MKKKSNKAKPSSDWDVWKAEKHFATCPATLAELFVHLDLCFSVSKELVNFILQNKLRPAGLGSTCL